VESLRQAQTDAAAEQANPTP